ncbi:MAG: hypothetical protein JO027_12330 [Solirubrobacterales bacterium]|nr:hypothetical protein [Solirubrobacterales bacterium]
MPDLDELYGLPMDEFVPARNALARELRSSGRREEASEVAALRKPSVAAWAVNQLVRTQRKAVDELFEAGDALRGAHDQVLSGGGDAVSLRRAVARERAAVDALTRAARGLLTSEGHELSTTIIDRVSDTLHATALDDDARAQVRDGRLERELRHVGLGMTAPAPGPAPAAGPAPAQGPAPARAPGRRAPTTKPKKVAEAERAAAAERAKARSEARAAEREARRRVERATRAAGAARERRDKAVQALEEAEHALAEAERERSESEAELDAAERAVRDLAG